MDVRGMDMEASSLYPLFVNMADEKCLVVGGGEVAERRIEGLLEAGARVDVISPEVTPVIQVWALEGRIRYISRPYDGERDGRDAVLIYAATDDATVNEQVVRDSRSRRQWVNRVDLQESGNVYIPASFTRGLLHIAVSTSGASPGMAVKIKQQLEKEYGPEYGEALDWIHSVRKKILKVVRNRQKRRRLLQDIIELDPVLLIREHRHIELDQIVEQWLQQTMDEQTEEDV